jgi:Uma2 family endonuclease
MPTATSLPRRPWTADEFARMVDLGLLPESGVELVDGEVREMDAWGSPHRFTFEDWQRMEEGGIVDGDERLELADGSLVRMSPLGDRHMYTVDLVAEYLWGRMQGRAIVRVQSTLKLFPGEAPAPDLALLRMRDDRYQSHRAEPADALLVIEVSDTTLARDREKIGLYASAEIPEYWLVNVKRSIVTVYAAPVSGGYADVREYRHGQSFASPALGGLEVSVEHVLGPA